MTADLITSDYRGNRHAEQGRQQVTMTREFRAQCDNCDRKADQAAPFSNEAKEKARAAGWKITNTATCPECIAAALRTTANAMLAQADTLASSNDGGAA